MVKVIERVWKRYEVQDVEFGKLYTWRPERIVVECEWGRRLSMTGSTTSCAECGSDHTDTFRNESAEVYRSYDALHPRRYSEDREAEQGLLPSFELPFLVLPL
jgi:hypothetical protein